MLSGRLSDEFAAWRGLLMKSPAVEATSLLAAPHVSELSLGDGKGQFPASREDWKGKSLALLVGTVPAALAQGDDQNWAEAIEALKQAIEDGMHVVIQDDDDGSGTSWARTLGISVERVEAPGPLRIHPRLWPDLYQLGADEASSLARWSELRHPSVCRVVRSPGIPLLLCEQGAVLKRLPRGKGAILYCGLPELKALAPRGARRVINRIRASILAAALPAPEQATDRAALPGVFPPQPVLGKYLVVTDAGGTDLVTEGLQADETEGLPGHVYQVTGRETVTIEESGNRRTLQVHVPLATGNFDLAARAAPLREIAKLGAGETCTVGDLPRRLAPAPGRAAPPRRTIWSVSFWDSRWWPLALLLALVSLEYLCRRRTGRVM